MTKYRKTTWFAAFCQGRPTFGENGRFPEVWPSFWPQILAQTGPRPAQPGPKSDQKKTEKSIPRFFFPGIGRNGPHILSTKPTESRKKVTFFIRKWRFFAKTASRRESGKPAQNQ
jgi:hypothetical protein